MAVDIDPPHQAHVEEPVTTGPPMLVVLVGFASLATSLAMVAVPGTRAIHMLGYLTGAIIPILVIGLARRLDLERRRTSAYRPGSWFRTGLFLLGVLALVAALVHIWQLATDLAS